MKTGKISAPGINSINETTLTQRSITKHAMIPAISRKSPTVGKSRIVKMYSLMSNAMQAMRKSSSSSANKKYLGTDWELFFHGLIYLASDSKIPFS
jgi:hypothetical protein